VSSEGRKKIVIEYFTDVLCIWAYGAQVRIDELKREFRHEVEIVYRFIPLFGATSKRIGEGWADRGGFEGFNRHTLEVASAWDHVSVDSAVWTGCRPPSSIVVHLFLKAVQLAEQGGQVEAAGSAGGDRTPFEAAVWRAREAFFGQALNVCDRAVQIEIMRELALPIDEIGRLMENGEAYAALHEDHEAQTEYRVPGSPTLIMNEGRQRLYGNLGYRILRANVEELLRDPRSGEASWC
jgi:predicted DsbA family dithiol-disulfide isomerase